MLRRLTTHYFEKLKFRTKLTLGITSIVLALALLLSVFLSRMAADALVAENKNRGAVMARNLSSRSLDPLLAIDLLRLKNMVDELRRAGGDIEYAFILDKEGHVLAHTFSGGFPVELATANRAPLTDGVAIQLIYTGPEYIYDFAAPVTVAREQLGTVRIGLSRTKIQQTVNRLVMTIAGISGVALLIALSLATLFSRQVTRRINILRDYAEEVVKGNLDLQTGPTLPKNCWEIMQCDRAECPAFGDTRRRCWYLKGTMCPDCGPNAFPQKLESCRKCPVYKHNVGDEIQDLAETFDIMALSLKAHISEIKEAERVLMEQQRIMRTILDVTPDYVTLQTKDLTYQAVNRAFAAFVNKPLSQIIGKTDFDLFDPQEAERRNAENRESLNSGRRTDREALIRTDAGSKWFHVVRVPVLNEKKEIIGILSTSRDVSDIKSYQEQLIQSQKMESLGKLAGGVAHEINTPLGIILGYAQLLLEDLPEDSQVREDLSIIERQAKVCRKIVSDLLGFSRQSESRMGEMDLNHSILEVVSLVKHSFQLDNVRIVTEMEEDMPYLVGDREKLKQVWLNLLDNALDAMPEGGTIMVSTRLCPIGDKVVATFADTGEGISRDILGKIFDPFFSTKPVGKGTGLGLSVSFGIVESHGGRIEVQSPIPKKYRIPPEEAGEKPGQGTAFHVVLPLKPFQATAGCPETNEME